MGTVLAELVTAGLMLYYLLRRSPMLGLKGHGGSFVPRRTILQNAARISLPMAFEHAAISGAQIMTTVIVAPLGVVAIAANSFAIIIESICYMPGYGIAGPPPPWWGSASARGGTSCCGGLPTSPCGRA